MCLFYLLFGDFIQLLKLMWETKIAQTQAIKPRLQITAVEIMAKVQHQFLEIKMDRNTRNSSKKKLLT